MPPALAALGALLVLWIIPAIVGRVSDLRVKYGIYRTRRLARQILAERRNP